VVPAASSSMVSTSFSMAVIVSFAAASAAMMRR
jgi:hypothetical protein